MSRKAKNIISIIFILLLCGSIVFTEYLSNKLSNTNNSNNMPNMNQNGSEPPEIPNGNNEVAPPEKPDGDNNMGIPPEMPGNNGSMEPREEYQEKNTDNNYVYLILFGIESLCLSLIVIYLIMSKFNKKTFKETFANSDKILIYILGVIILTSGLTFTENLVGK